jgi:alkylhydroperoxidase family enzyme
VSDPRGHGPRVPVSDDPRPATVRYVEEARTLGTPNPDVYRVLEATPDLMRSFRAHWRDIFDGGIIETELKELVRRKMADVYGCATCSAAGVGMRAPANQKLEAAFDWRESREALDDRERAALWLAELLMGYETDADAVYLELHDRFSGPEIIELGWFIAFNVGTIQFVRSWRLHEAPT